MSELRKLILVSLEDPRTDVDLVRFILSTGHHASASGIRTRRKELTDMGYLGEVTRVTHVGKRKHILWGRTNKGSELVRTNGWGT